MPRLRGGTLLAAVLAAANSVAAASPLLTDLAAYWKFNGDLVDVVGGHNLTGFGSPAVSYDTGQSGQAVVLAAANSNYMTAPNHADLVGGKRSFTFDGWIRPTTVAGNFAIISKGSNDSSAANYEYFVFQNNQTVRIRISNGTTNTDLVIGNYLTTNEWHYFAVGYDADNSQVWGQIDGNNRATVQLLNGSHTTTDLLYFGKKFENETLYPSAWLEDIGRWNRYLTASESAARFAGAVYPF